MKKLFFVVMLAASSMFSVSAQTQIVTTLSDIFPRGSNTAEGAACDLARAFITSDTELLKTVCLKRYGGGEVGKKYADFLKMIVSGTEDEKKRAAPHPKSPAEIVKVYEARHLTKEGPASYAYAFYNLQDVMFVDIAAKLHDGTISTNRTMVVKHANGYWRVHPCPTIDDLLSAGLNEESPSTTEYKKK